MSFLPARSLANSCKFQEKAAVQNQGGNPGTKSHWFVAFVQQPCVVQYQDYRLHPQPCSGYNLVECTSQVRAVYRCHLPAQLRAVHSKAAQHATRGACAHLPLSPRDAPGVDRCACVATRFEQSTSQLNTSWVRPTAIRIDQAFEGGAIARPGMQAARECSV